MTEEHRRHLTTSVRYIGELLDEAEGYAGEARISDALVSARESLQEFARHFHLDLRAPAVDPTHAIRVQLSVASVSIADMRSRALRGYGPLDEREAHALDASCDDLESAIERAQHVLDGA